MSYFAWATHPSLSAGSSSTSGTFSRVRYPLRTVNQFEPVLTVPCASLVFDDDAGLSSATSEDIAAGLARCAARARRARDYTSALFVRSLADPPRAPAAAGTFAISA